MKRTLFLSLLIVFLTTSFMSLVGCNNQSPKELYDSQDKCGKRCEEYFKKNYYNKEGSYYRNHYNKKLNKCFILVFYDDGGPTEMLFDVNENKPLGYYTLYRGGTERCSMSSPWGNECKSRRDWDTLVKPYMEE